MHVAEGLRAVGRAERRPDLLVGAEGLLVAPPRRAVFAEHPVHVAEGLRAVGRAERRPDLLEGDERLLVAIPRRAVLAEPEVHVAEGLRAVGRAETIPDLFGRCLPHPQPVCHADGSREGQPAAKAIHKSSDRGRVHPRQRRVEGREFQCKQGVHTCRVLDDPRVCLLGQRQQIGVQRRDSLRLGGRMAFGPCPQGDTHREAVAVALKEAAPSEEDRCVLAVVSEHGGEEGAGSSGREEREEGDHLPGEAVGQRVHGHGDGEVEVVVLGESLGARDRERGGPLRFPASEDACKVGVVQETRRECDRQRKAIQVAEQCLPSRLVACPVGVAHRRREASEETPCRLSVEGLRHDLPQPEVALEPAAGDEKPCRRGVRDQVAEQRPHVGQLAGHRERLLHVVEHVQPGGVEHPPQRRARGLGYVESPLGRDRLQQRIHRLGRVEVHVPDARLGPCGRCRRDGLCHRACDLGLADSAHAGDGERAVGRQLRDDGFHEGGPALERLRRRRRRGGGDGSGLLGLFLEPLPDEFSRPLMLSRDVVGERIEHRFHLGTHSLRQPVSERYLCCCQVVRQSRRCRRRGPYEGQRLAEHEQDQLGEGGALFSLRHDEVSEGPGEVLCQRQHRSLLRLGAEVMLVVRPLRISLRGADHRRHDDAPAVGVEGVLGSGRRRLGEDVGDERRGVLDDEPPVCSDEDQRLCILRVRGEVGGRLRQHVGHGLPNDGLQMVVSVDVREVAGRTQPVLDLVGECARSQADDVLRSLQGSSTRCEGPSRRQARGDQPRDRAECRSCDQGLFSEGGCHRASQKRRGSEDTHVRSDAALSESASVRRPGSRGGRGQAADPSSSALPMRTSGTGAPPRSSTTRSMGV